MPVDLHVHSTASDGSVDPADLVTLALSKGLGAFALTDHDTQEGVPAAAESAARGGLDLIPGTELSLNYDDGGLHLVVLWLEPGDGPLQDRLGAAPPKRSECAQHRNCREAYRSEDAADNRGGLRGGGGRDRGPAPHRSRDGN